MEVTEFHSHGTKIPRLFLPRMKDDVLFPAQRHMDKAICDCVLLLRKQRIEMGIQTTEKGLITGTTLTVNGAKTNGPVSISEKMLGDR